MCSSAQRWQRFTCHLPQRTASLWSTASTTRPTIATHVSATPSWTAWCRVTPMDAFYLRHSHFQPCFAAHCSILERVWIACTRTVPVWYLFKLFERLSVFYCPLLLDLQFCYLFLFAISSPKVQLTSSAAMRESNKFFNLLSFFLFFCLFGVWICPPAGIPKTQSPSSTISSLKRPLVSTSSPAAPTMLGTSMTRRTRISSGAPPQLHPCHRACTLRPHRTRYLQDIIFITEQLGALSWFEMTGDILMCFHSAESGRWHRNWGVSQTGTSRDRSSKPPWCAGGGHRVRVRQRQGCQV